MRDIGEGTAMNERRIVLEGLREIWLQRVLQQHGHRPMRVQIAGVNGL